MLLMTVMAAFNTGSFYGKSKGNFMLLISSSLANTVGRCYFDFVTLLYVMAKTALIT